MKIYYCPNLEQLDNQECYLYFTSDSTLFLKSGDTISRVSETFKINDSNIEAYAKSRGFVRVVEAFKDSEFSSPSVIWELEYSSDEAKKKIKDNAEAMKKLLIDKTRLKVIKDNTIGTCLKELGYIK
jgi:ribonuclease BN (tRNA processing enzyme)